MHDSQSARPAGAPRDKSGAERPPSAFRRGAWRFRGTLGASVLLIAFGLACFNYTKPSGLEHHTRVAAERGLLPPGDGVLLMGYGSAMLGAAGVGWTLRRPRGERT